MPTPTALPSAFSAGDVLTAANINLLRGGFRVLQVVASTTATAVSNSTNVNADTTLTATITPQFTTSKILVCVTQPCFKDTGNVGSAVILNLVRNATTIALLAGAMCFTASSLVNIGLVSGNILDSPSTTSATTYKTIFRNAVNAASVGVNNNGSNATMILLEVSA